MEAHILNLLPIVSLVIAFILSYFGLKGQDKEIRVWKAVAMSLITGIFVAAVQIKITMNGIEKATGALAGNEITTEYMRTLDDTYAIHQGLGEIYRKNFSDHQKYLQKIVSQAKVKEYKISKDDIKNVAMLLIDHASKNIYATSYVKEEDWWRTAWGKTYLKANKQAVSRGVKIERIFIFPNEESF